MYRVLDFSSIVFQLLLHCLYLVSDCLDFVSHGLDIVLNLLHVIPHAVSHGIQVGSYTVDVILYAFDAVRKLFLQLILACGEVLPKGINAVRKRFLQLILVGGEVLPKGIEALCDICIEILESRWSIFGQLSEQHRCLVDLCLYNLFFRDGITPY